MIFIEAVLEPNIFLTTATNDFCLLLLGNRNGNPKQQKLSQLILIIIISKGLFHFWLSMLFHILKCSPDFVVQLNRVFDCLCFAKKARENAFYLTAWQIDFFSAEYCWILQLKSGVVMSQIYFHSLFLKQNLQFLNFVFFLESFWKEGEFF